MNHYDHHQEEHRQRRRSATGMDYEPGYNLSLHNKKKSTKTPRPSFWLWIWVSPRRFAWLLLTAVLLAMTAGYFLACDGTYVIFAELSQRQLMTRSTAFGVLSIFDVAAIIIAWRRYKYFHVAGDGADSADA